MLFPAHVMCAFGAVLFVLVLISLFNGMFFYVDEAGYYADGPWEILIYVFDVAVIIAEKGRRGIDDKAISPRT